MAYLDLGLAEAAATGTASPAPAPQALGTTERRVVRLALEEARMRNAFAPPTTLASERLEAIRLYAARYRRRGARLPASSHQLLHDAGVTELEAYEIRALVDEDRNRAGEAGTGQTFAARTARFSGLLLLSAIPIAAGALLYGWLARQLDDRLGAMVLSIILLLGLVSPIILAGHPTRTR